VSTETNKAMIRHFIEEVVNTGDVVRLADFIAPNCRQSDDPTCEAVGPDAMRTHLLGVRQTFPDLRVTVEQQIAEGDWVATRITARATHLGWWRGIKPTGRRVEISGINVDRVVDGRIVEHGGAANMLEAFLSIGAVQVVGGSPSED